MNLIALLFKTEGRLNRLSFFLLFIIINVGYTIIINIVSTIFRRSLTYKTIEILFVILLILLFVNLIFLTIKRCHDFGKSVYFLIIYILAVTGIIIAALKVASILKVDSYTLSMILTIIMLISLFYFFLKPGSDEANQYGNQPEHLFDLGLNGFKEKISSSDISDNKSNNEQ